MLIDHSSRCFLNLRMWHLKIILLFSKHVCVNILHVSKVNFNFLAVAKKYEMRNEKHKITAVPTAGTVCIASLNEVIVLLQY